MVLYRKEDNNMVFYKVHTGFKFSDGLKVGIDVLKVGLYDFSFEVSFHREFPITDIPATEQEFNASYLKAAAALEGKFVNTPIVN